MNITRLVFLCMSFCFLVNGTVKAGLWPENAQCPKENITTTIIVVVGCCAIAYSYLYCFASEKMMPANRQKKNQLSFLNGEWFHSRELIHNTL
jgi:hypothetical protein